jgi:hypothetical protein
MGEEIHLIIATGFSGKLKIACEAFLLALKKFALGHAAALRTATGDPRDQSGCCSPALPLLTVFSAEKIPLLSAQLKAFK